MTEWFRCCENLKCLKSSFAIIQSIVDILFMLVLTKMMNKHETKETQYGIHSCIKPYIDRYMGFNIKIIHGLQYKFIWNHIETIDGSFLVCLYSLLTIPSYIHVPLILLLISSNIKNPEFLPVINQPCKSWRCFDCTTRPLFYSH